jgi:Domain of unknown function (DUF4157)
LKSTESHTKQPSFNSVLLKTNKGGITLPSIPVLQNKETEVVPIQDFFVEQKTTTQLFTDKDNRTQLKSYQLKPNNTGLPDNLKTGVENLSGMDMSDVKVHYNSSQPAQLSALAYAQGNDIHIGPGQEKHLPHEAWHVVQQRQGRVQATKQMKMGVAINDDVSLESEADVMGEKALSNTVSGFSDKGSVQFYSTFSDNKTIQRAVNKTNEEEDNDPVVGKMSYSFKWQATDPHHNGFILQKVTRTETVNPNDENTVTVSAYWEAWKVVNTVIFDGLQDISGIQHDSWFNNQMPVSSDGTISMDCKVYFVTTDEIEGMEHGAIAMAGSLLSSAGEPAVEKVHLFDHNYNYVWNRKLIGDNLLEVVRKEMRNTLEVSSEEGQTFADMVVKWEVEEWNDFRDAVNANDPAHEKTREEIIELTNQIQL